MRIHKGKYLSKPFKYFFFFMKLITKVMAIPEIIPTANILVFRRLTHFLFSTISLSEFCSSFYVQASTFIGTSLIF